MIIGTPLQVQVEGVSNAVVGVTIEMKPRRRNKRSVLYDMTGEFVASGHGGRALGSYGRMEARHIHMLLQNELFINIGTMENPEGELRGQIRTLLYNGLESNRHGKTDRHEKNERSTAIYMKCFL